MIFQDYAVFPWMTAINNIKFTLKLRKVPRKNREEIALKYLNLVGLKGFENKYPSQLSGGMVQRLALARALSVEPKAILMDEPFAAVDSITREKLQDDLLNIWKQTGVTIVMVTHDINEALYLSDKVVVFSPNPGTIRNVLEIDIPRPRSRNDNRLFEYNKRIQTLFEYDKNYESEYSI